MCVEPGLLLGAQRDPLVRAMRHRLSPDRRPEQQPAQMQKNSARELTKQNARQHVALALSRPPSQVSATSATHLKLLGTQLKHGVAQRAENIPQLLWCISARRRNPARGSGVGRCSAADDKIATTPVVQILSVQSPRFPMIRKDISPGLLVCGPLLVGNVAQATPLPYTSGGVGLVYDDDDAPMSSATPGLTWTRHADLAATRNFGIAGTKPAFVHAQASGRSRETPSQPVACKSPPIGLCDLDQWPRTRVSRRPLPSLRSASLPQRHNPGVDHA